MTLFFYLAFLVLGIILGHVIAIERTKLRFNDVPAYETKGVLDRLAVESLHKIVTLIDVTRPRCFFGAKIAWQLVMQPNLKEGAVIEKCFARSIVIVLRENIDIDSCGLVANDPCDRFGAAARKIAERILAEPIAGFVTSEKILGLDHCSIVTDPVTNVQLRLLRGYDLQTNTFITNMSVKIIRPYIRQI